MGLPAFQTAHCYGCGNVPCWVGPKGSRRRRHHSPRRWNQQMAPQESRLDWGASFSGVYAGPHAILCPPKGWRPNVALDDSYGVNHMVIPPTYF